MLPAVLLVAVTFTYSIAWVLYWNMAGARTFSALPLNPRRVWKVNKVFFSVVLSNLTLIPIGLSLLKYRYWTVRGSTQVVMNVHYNPERPHNTLDVYVPQDPAQVMDSKSYRLSEKTRNDAKTLRPVIVFIYGGAWSSGSKWMYTLVGARLRSMGYVVVVPDYSIFPQGQIFDMEQDVRRAIQWAYRNCMTFGGDPQRIYIKGHSAGAHLCALTILNDSIQRIPPSLFGSSPTAISTSPILSTLFSRNLQSKNDSDDALPRIRGMILCSGVYEIGEHFKHETMRGVEEISAMARVMGNSESSFRTYSPTCILQELLQVSTRVDRNYPTESQTRHRNMLRHLKSLLPAETLVVHGDLDQTVPMRSSSEFYMELKTLQLGPSAKFRIIQGMGHEEPVVALMPCSARDAPFRQALMDEISQFIDARRA
ncbi:hypothetical protein BGZ70_004682 [Mortierella alpina]|uniref:BD-FAE-like domain-containing protein n=1 Tax=Mortierella alpina TaxID=64518 RepID=A0A9P6M3Z2_MORAP|nr:hypothetical protein BGZ70_004682 [Mortierella alpina]